MDTNKKILTVLERMADMSRKDDVLTMQVLLMPELAKAWNISYSDLAQIVKKYHVLNYIDAKYDMYNSTGTSGVIEDLSEYVHSKEMSA